jgi:hypothetical protein
MPLRWAMAIFLFTVLREGVEAERIGDAFGAQRSRPPGAQAL